jgi:hypothetical protein
MLHISRQGHSRPGEISVEQLLLKPPVGPRGAETFRRHEAALWHCAGAVGPAPLIIDEPTAGLDPAERRRFQNPLAEVGEESPDPVHIVDDVDELCPRSRSWAGTHSGQGKAGYRRACDRPWTTVVRETPRTFAARQVLTS